jgi:hypothetical protein
VLCCVVMCSVASGTYSRKVESCGEDTTGRLSSVLLQPGVDMMNASERGEEEDKAGGMGGQHQRSTRVPLQNR